MTRSKPSIPIPRDRLTVRYSRSGGPGGQHVNKVETKVEIRFTLDEADWIPEDIRERLRARTRLTSAGEVVITSSRSRSQSSNFDDCVAKLRQLIDESERPPPPRKPTRPSRRAKARRLESKRRRGALKQGRNWQPEPE